MRTALYALLIGLLSLPFSLGAFQYIPFEDEGRFGIKDSSNQVMIPARYQKVGWSKENFRVVNNVIGALINDRWALIDLKGSNITPHRFATIIPTPLHTFIVAERKRNSIRTQYGIINARGKEILPLEFIEIRAVDETALMVRTERNGSFFAGLIDYNGQTRIDLDYRSIVPLSKGRLTVENQEGLKAIFSTMGEPLTAFQYTQIFSLNEGIIFIERYNHIGLLNPQAQMIVPPLYKEIQVKNDQIMVLPFAQWSYFEHSESKGVFYEDEVFFGGKNKLWFNAGRRSSLVDPSSGKVTPLKDLSITDANKKMALVRHTENKGYYMLNAKATLIKPDVFDSAVLSDQGFFGLQDLAGRKEWLAYDTLGKAQSLFTYSSLRPIPNDMYVAKRANKVGLLNAKGKDISPFIYDSIGVFKNEMAIAQYQGRFGVINTRGNWMITPYYDSLAFSHDNFYFKQGSFQGIMDPYGKVLFRENKAFIPLPVGFIRQSDQGYQLFKENGTLALDYHYDTIQAIQEDVVFLKRAGLNFLYHLKDSGSYAIGKEIEVVRPGKEGWIPIQKNGQWGLLDLKGRLKIANRYQEIRPFSEERAPVKLIGKWGFVNVNETLVIQPNYDDVEDFLQGHAIVRQGNVYGLINQDGKVILPIQYSKIQRLENNYLLVEENAKLGLTDVKGVFLKNPQFNQLRFIGEEYILVETEGKYGVIDVKGADIVPAIYEAIKYSGNRFLGKISATWETFN